MRRYRGIILDFNGTLFWDTDFHVEAWIAFAQQYGYELDRKSYLRDFHGHTSIACLERIIGTHLTRDQLSELFEQKERVYRDMCDASPDKAVFAPGVRHFLDIIKRYAVPRTIATASAWPNVEFFIDRFSLGSWFDPAAFVYDDGHTPNKPHPAIYQRAAENLGIPPSDLIVVKDSLSGFTSAYRAGIGLILLTGNDLHDILPHDMANTQPTPISRIASVFQGLSEEEAHQVSTSGSLQMVMPTFDAFPWEYLSV